MNGRRAGCALMVVTLVFGTAARRLGAGEAAPPAPDDLVPMTIADVRLDAPAEGPMVILETARKDRALVLIVGPAEAVAILSQLRGAPPPPRPMTHDLLKSVITQLGAKLDHVAITRLERGTFHGELVLHQGEKVVRVDARPSDAMALALRARVPILVARQVLEEAGTDPDRLRRPEEPEPEPPRLPRPDPEWTL